MACLTLGMPREKVVKTIFKFYKLLYSYYCFCGQIEFAFLRIFYFGSILAFNCIVSQSLASTSKLIS